MEEDDERHYYREGRYDYQDDHYPEARRQQRQNYRNDDVFREGRRWQNYRDDDFRQRHNYNREDFREIRRPADQGRFYDGGGDDFRRRWPGERDYRHPSGQQQWDNYHHDGANHSRDRYRGGDFYSPDERAPRETDRGMDRAFPVFPRRGGRGYRVPNPNPFFKKPLP